jgi:preprotein translocase subunit SecG
MCGILISPEGNISVVATETGLTPPTSIPVLMREMQSDLLHAQASNSSNSRNSGSSGTSGILSGVFLCFLLFAVCILLYLMSYCSDGTRIYEDFAAPTASPCHRLVREHY